MRHRPVEDLSELPTYAFGARMTTWWATLGFCALEGAGFAMAIGAYLYLAFINPQWPLSAPPPGLLWSSLVTVLIVVSVWPNYLAKESAKRQDIWAVRKYLVIVAILAVAIVGLRFMEFSTLYVRWDQNAYGSILWFILGLHTAHILTDLGDTIVLTVLMFTRHGHGKRFSDVEDNAFYWNFVVAAWLPIYALLYWGPRL